MIKDKVSNIAYNIVHENKIAIALRKNYYDYALIHKDKWLSFISDPQKTSEPCDKNLLAACFEILGNLPIRKEIKHDYGQLKAKLLESQIDLGLDPNFDIDWDLPKHELMQKVNNLQGLIEEEAKVRNC